MKVLVANFQTWNASGADNLVLPAPLAVQKAAHAAERCTVFTAKVGSAVADVLFLFKLPVRQTPRCCGGADTVAPTRQR